MCIRICNEWFYDYRQLKDGKKKDPNGKKLTAAEQIKFLEEASARRRWPKK